MPVLNMIPRVMIYLYIRYLHLLLHIKFELTSLQIKMQLISRQWIREIVVHHCPSLLLEHYAHSYRNDTKYIWKVNNQY